jgi:hypothetical protein
VCLCVTSVSVVLLRWHVYVISRCVPENLEDIVLVQVAGSFRFGRSLIAHIGQKFFNIYIKEVVNESRIFVFCGFVWKFLVFAGCRAVQEIFSETIWKVRDSEAPSFCLCIFFILSHPLGVCLHSRCVLCL